MFTDSRNLRSIPRARVWTVVIPSVLALVTLVAGWVGTYRYLTISAQYGELSRPDRVVEAGLVAVGFFGLNSGPFPATLAESFPLVVVGRFSGALFVSYAAVLTLLTLFASRLRPVQIGFLYHLDRVRDADAPGHVVVCGLDSHGLDLATQLAAQGRRVVAVERKGDAAAIRQARDAGIWVFTGDATAADLLCGRAKAHLASEVFVVGEEDETNAAVVQTLAQAVDGGSGAAGGRPATDCYADVSATQVRHHLHERVEDVPGLYLYSYDEPTATARELLANRPVDRLEAATDGSRVHVVLVGWDDITKAILARLCHTLHVEPEVERAVTVVSRDPAAAEREFYAEYPGVDTGDWDDPTVRDYIDELFPSLSFLGLPASHERLLSDGAELPARFGPDDVLTVFVGGTGGLETGSLVSTLVPRLEEYEEEYEMDTTVHFFEDDQWEARTDELVDAKTSDRLTVRSFGPFDAGVSPDSVRGDRRDRLAKHIALFYHLRYDLPPGDDAEAWERDLIDEVGSLDGFSAVLDAWHDLDEGQRTRFARACWTDLAEHYRDANRFAADHVPLKRRVADRLVAGGRGEQALDDGLDHDDVVDAIARVEHERWCAEKVLSGWEPLRRDRWDEWQDPDRQARLRAQQYHRDLWPLDALADLPADEFEKDVSQVRFVLDALTTDSDTDD
ncbi:NAD-binding protein [Haloarchaeobius amylolyticus]|uniref:NAD-binding protein n=1 Tax=Haloarchaeobius amylolyticus TaxID=1198296 RepID=UPI002270D91D|nr:NAD-binding protein [Haloarchaeobius amylolyticus]